MTSLRYLLNCRSFISLMVLFSFFDNFGMDTYNSYLIKVVFVGDAAVGKTQIISRYMKNSFKNEYKASFGVEFAAKEVKFKNKKRKLQLWDTAGQEKFKSTIKSYYKNSNLIVLVYAINDLQSFKNIPKWVDEVKEQIDEKTKFLLIGNKCDLNEERQVSKEEAQKYAEENNMKFIEISAYAETDIENMFNSIIQDLLDDMEKDFTHNNHQYIGPEIPVYSIQDIDDIKTSFCDKYCSCCPCLKKTKKNNEEQEEEEEGDDDDKDDDEE